MCEAAKQHDRMGLDPAQVDQAGQSIECAVDQQVDEKNRHWDRLFDPLGHGGQQHQYQE